ncbi:MAG TPA: hypothetical protein VEZ71_08020 [Archangium sp.]|nr:hypothetical protein [Archangium sp.]
MSTPAPKVVVFLHSGDHDRVHPGLSIAAAVWTASTSSQFQRFPRV